LGGIAPVAQFSMFAAYIATNPELVGDFAQGPCDLDPR
jgi:hypothetical protein